jgi:hypothetical protein
VEVFNTGKDKLKYSIENKNRWIKVSEEKGTVNDQTKIWASIDWDKAPKGENQGQITIKVSDKNSVSVQVPVNNRQSDTAVGFVESNGYIAIEAANYAENVANGETGWKKIPELGRTGTSALGIFPATYQNEDLNADSPHLVYNFHTFSSGQAEIEFVLAPTLDFTNSGGLRFAVSVDGKEPQIVNMHTDTDDNWDTTVSNYATRVNTDINFENPGNHTLKVWPIDPGVVLQRIIIKTGKVEDSYLGPPESAKASGK